MGHSFQTIKTRPPWYKRPGSLGALGVFVVLGAVVGFLLKGNETTLLARVKANDPVSPYCAYALGWRGIKLDETRDEFEKILATGMTDKPAPEDVRRAAAYALGQTKQKHVVLFLIDAIAKDPSVPVRCTSCRALGKTGEPQGNDPLVLALGAHEADVRQAAAEGCQLLGDKRAVDRLIDQLDDPVPAVRRACHEALVTLTGTSFDGQDEKAAWRRWREAGH